jgi:hypothetical protein
MQHSDLCRVKRRERQEISEEWMQLTPGDQPQHMPHSGISLPTVN